jgi:hypothetical protein
VKVENLQRGTAAARNWEEKPLYASAATVMIVF